MLGVVGARSGSKSIPNKNIKPLLGKPLMAWIIEAAKKSRYISRLIVSTDSPKYAEIAKKYGAEVPFLRPRELARDYSLDVEYLTHAVKWLEKNNSWKADIILRLTPTSPLCKPEFIDRCVELLLENKNADSARTVTPAQHHPYKTWKEENGYLKPLLTKEITGFDVPGELPRQLFPTVYVHSDPVAVRYDALINKKNMGRKTRFHIISSEDAVDIDNEIDYLLAETILKKRLRQ